MTESLRMAHGQAFAGTSRMLGECFSLLENRDIEIKLPAADPTGEPYALKLPKRLYVIGTMNLIGPLRPAPRSRPMRVTLP